MKKILLLLLYPIIIYSQEYVVGRAVNDTICPSSTYYSDDSDCSLAFGLDSILITYVTGLTFQIEITAVEGIVISNFGDTLKVGDTFSLPALNETGSIIMSFTKFGDYFSYLIKLVGTPEIVGETYYCNLDCWMTLTLCNNWVGVWPVSDSLCTVKSVPSSIEYNPELITNYHLKVNYPNPFNPTTTITYQLSIKGIVQLTVHDISGRKIKTLVNQNQNPGEHSVIFSGSGLASGIYIYKLKAGSFEQSRKMLLLQ